MSLSEGKGRKGWLVCSQPAPPPRLCTQRTGCPPSEARLRAHCPPPNAPQGNIEAEMEEKRKREQREAKKKVGGGGNRVTG